MDLLVGILVAVYVFGGTASEVQVESVGLYDLTTCQERAAKLQSRQEEPVHPSGRTALSLSYTCLPFPQGEIEDALEQLAAS